MKAAVIYAGKYGTTERYARWIGEEVGGDLFPQKECRVKDLEDYDVIVFGGAIHAGAIMGIDFLRKNFGALKDKKILTFAVGLNVFDEEACRECRELNFVKQPSGLKRLLSGGNAAARMSDEEERFSQLPCWFFPGAYDPQKVTGMDKKMMGVVGRMIGGKRQEEITGAERLLLQAIEDGADYVDKEAIRPLIEFLL